MLSISKPLKTNFRHFPVIFFIALILFPLIINSNDINTIEMKNDQTTEILTGVTPESSNLKIMADNALIENYTFDIQELLNYLNSLYTTNRFHESVGGFPTTTAIYEGLSILRFLGLDYYKFGSEWQTEENAIASQLLVEYRDEADSGGFKLIPSDVQPSLEGSFGVVTSLWIMNEIWEGIKLKDASLDLLDFVYNRTFDKIELEFHEEDNEASIKATFQALTILDLLQKISVNQIPIPDPNFDYDIDFIAKPLNETIYEFMANYSVNILNYIDSFWENDSVFLYFNSHTPYQTPIVDTWYALQSIKILERFESLINGLSLPNHTEDYRTSVVDWLKSLQKTTGTTTGGFGLSTSATVSETGMSYAILDLFNATSQINHTKTLAFISSSQFLKRENRTYTELENGQEGGFSPNNFTHSDPLLNKLVNIHSSYFAVLTLLLSGDIFNSTELLLKTDQYESYPSINRTNLIIQGERATIDLELKIYDYKSHGSLNLLSVIDNWNLTHIDYLETTSSFSGKSVAVYEVKLQDDTLANFNWSLGLHQITNMISIRALPIIKSPIYYKNSTVFVSYASNVIFNQTEIKPGDNVSTTVSYHNRTVPSFSQNNITYGSLSANITSPNKQIENIIQYVPINITSGAITFFINFSKQALLGIWDLNLIFNQSSFILRTNGAITVTDTVILYNLSSLPVYYPGENTNLNVSLKYTNGMFTPNANATLIFDSTQTQLAIFNLTLSYLESNVYTTNGTNCPTQFLFGHYNVSVQLTWNKSKELESETIFNSSLPVVNIEGFPTISKAYYKTDYRNDQVLQTDNNIIHYGETINISLTIGFKSSLSINNITKESITILGGLVNNINPASFIQQFDISQRNETTFASGLIDPNLPATIYELRFQIKSEWNNSFVYIRDQDNISTFIGYNLTLQGELEIYNVAYSTTTQSEGLYEYALDSTPVFNVSFQIVNKNYQNIPVPNLNLYAILDLQDRLGTLNSSLPGVALGYSENRTLNYIVSISTISLSPDKYTISVYTETAISAKTEIGNLSPGFLIVKSFVSKPLIQFHEVLILISGIGFIILLSLNLKKFR